MVRMLVTSVAVFASLAAAASAGAPADGAWVNGVAERLVTGPPAGTSHPAPLYVISPVNLSHALHPAASARLHGFGAHDHVLAAAGRSYSGNCDLRLVVPGAKAIVGSNVAVRHTLTPAGGKPLLYAARLGNRMLPLTSAARVQQAAAAGLATIVDTHTILACKVSPR